MSSAPAAIEPITVFVAATECSAPASIGTTNSAAVATGDATLGMQLALAALPRHLVHPDRPYLRDAMNALARIEAAGGVLCGGDDASDARWFDVTAMPQGLAFDHATILADGLARLETAPA